MSWTRRNYFEPKNESCTILGTRDVAEKKQNSSAGEASLHLRRNRLKDTWTKKYIFQEITRVRRITKQNKGVGRMREKDYLRGSGEELSKKVTFD